MRRRALGPEHPDTLKALANLASLRLEQGRDLEAEELLGAALDGLTRAVGADDPRTLGVLSNLAVIRARRSDDAEGDEEALALHRRVLEGTRRALGPEHENTLGALLNLADLLADMGRVDEAEAPLREAVETWARVHGPLHPGALLARMNLGMLESRRGNHAEAEALVRGVVDDRARVSGERHADTLSALANLGFVRARAGDAAGAEEAWTEAWEGLRGARGDAHPTTMTVAGQLITMLHAQGWPESALPLGARLVASLRAVASAERDLAARDLNRIAWTLVAEAPPALRDPATALGLARRACDRERASGGGALWMYLDTLAAAQHATGAHAAAAATQRECLQRMPDPGASVRAELEERLREYEAAAGQ
jgi:tetratricopeptide (TPR) repeat protein